MHLKHLTFLLPFLTSIVFGQITFPEAKTMARELRSHSNSYFTGFLDHPGYGAPIILTQDGGASFFAEPSGENTVDLVKLDATGTVQWRVQILKTFDVIEIQSVIEDGEGNLYGFMLSYDHSRPRGDTERIFCVDKDGNLLWDKTLGDYTTLNNPVCSWIHLAEDGRVEMRGHIAPQHREGAADPDYHFWTAWVNAAGEMTQETGGQIDWSDPAWKNFCEIK